MVNNYSLEMEDGGHLHWALKTEVSILEKMLGPLPLNGLEHQGEVFIDGKMFTTGICQSLKINHQTTSFF